MMKVVILHLSDIHIKNSNDPILERGEAIAASVYPFLPSASHVFVVVSGDIAFSGEDSQYALANEFFEEIKTKILKESTIPVSFITVAGNHDCNFSLNSGTRQIVVNNVQNSSNPVIDSSIIDTCTSIQKSFFEFRNALECNEIIYDDPLWRSCHFNINGISLNFEALNISWISNQSENSGSLYFPVDLYSQMDISGVDIRLLVMHHPLNWFSQSIYRPFRRFIRNRADIIISGHEHMGNVGINHDAESDRSTFVEGCVLQEDTRPLDSSFNTVVIELDQKQFLSTRHKWDGTRYIPTEEGSWTNYHDLPMKKNPFAIEPTFQEILDDPGAFFQHPGGHKITLSDIFVYPDLRKISNGGTKERRFISSENLRSPDFTINGVLIEGDEKVGCTSLLYQLYRQYHDRGFVPLLINGKHLKKTQENEIDALIKREIGNQYGVSSTTAFEQLPKDQKILFLDDFDDGPLKAADARRGVLCELRKRFGHLVVTVNEMFELREMLSGDVPRELMLLEHYHMQAFGYARRSQLIQRWFSLAKDGTVDEAEFIARCDQAERLMNAVMTKTVIPSVPLYLLTLLQSIEAGRSGDFKESALGHYYHYLLTEALRNSGVKNDRLTEVFQYTAQLAAEFHYQQKSELSESELLDFNTRFSAKWHTVDFRERIDMLVRARVLRRIGDYYSFRYPYIYYYLKGLYLNENLSDVKIREYVRHCCMHLYVRDYANTILFLAHHTNDEFVINTLSEAIHGLFQNRAPVAFNGDTDGITTLIEDAPKLIYSGEKPLQHRKKADELRDQFDDGSDGLAESEEKTDELSLLAQIIALSKTTEILGQVLKNQYSKIERPRKSTLLEELFNGPLRALADFYAFCQNKPDSIVAEIEAAIQRKGKVENEEARKKIARRVVASLVQIMTFGFVMKTARSANSDSLLEDINDVVKRNDTLAFKLIDLCIHLDSPKPIPKQKLSQLCKEAEKDLVASRIISLMVLNRLYMFKTTEQEMQWLQEKLDINIKKQHVITYQKDKQRLIK